MSFTDPPTKRAGDSWSSADNNTFVRDNFPVLLPNGFTAVGELPVGSGSGTGGLLGIGTNFHLLVADSAQALGMKYAITPSRDLIQAKGDVLTATGSKAIARLAVGADGQILTSSQAASGGWRWLNTNTTVVRVVETGTAVDQTWTMLDSSDTEAFDPDNTFTAGLYYVPVGKDGIYLIAYEYDLTGGQTVTTLKAKVIYSSGAGEVLTSHRQMNTTHGIDHHFVFGAAIVPGVAETYIYTEIYQDSAGDLSGSVKLMIAKLL